MFKRLLPLFAVLALSACVDTTGLSGDTSRTPHPGSNPNAAVVVQEWADLQCPACRSAHEIIVKPLMETQGSRIRYEFKQFPLVSIHRYALDAAEASECAADQGKFWEFIDLDYTEQEKLTKDIFEDWGKTIGIADIALFNRCIDSHIKRDMILDEYEAGRALGVQGTPTFFVNGQKVDSTLEAITTAIDTAIGAGANML